MIKKLINDRRLPDVLQTSEGIKIKSSEEFKKHKEYIKSILCKYEYGEIPPNPEKTQYETILNDNTFCAGKVIFNKINIKTTVLGQEFSFIFDLAVPKTKEKVPAFVLINFRNNNPDKYLPTEEICDNGFAVASFCYLDVTSDDNNFNDKFAEICKKNNLSSGKIAMWAWAAMRVMDYLQTLDTIDQKNIAVVGHSRLGKTALLAGGFDERFSFVISNNSGCSGAALSRGKIGETIRDIYERFPYWFCREYSNFMDKEGRLPFDQHFLLALSAPRNIYVASAEKDIWADPVSEFLCCIALSDVYALYGKEGIISGNRLPKVNEVYHEGGIGYHLREGQHYLSRYDWLQYMIYIRKHYM